MSTAFYYAYATHVTQELLPQLAGIMIYAVVTISTGGILNHFIKKETSQ